MDANNETDACKTVPPLVYSKEVRTAFLKSQRIDLRFRRTTSWGDGIVGIDCKRETSASDYLIIAHYQCRASIGNGYLDALRKVPNRDGFGGWNEYSREDGNIYRPSEGFWSLNYVNQNVHERAIFQRLPSGSELTFHVRLDYGSSPVVAEAGLHVDVLELEARKHSQLHIVLDQQIGRHNSARFGYNR